MASSITSVTGSVAAGVTFPVDVLMKSDVVERLQLAGLEDDLEMGRGTRRLDRHDLIEHRGVVARQECPAVDDHVHLVGTGLDGLTCLGELDVRERLA
jgi:hypothetical protein